ncbi:MAG: SO_0444 family Cu/Zn efflux transporter [Marinomonas sp.]|uniref:SO_0444 family Cu/Zn efflux transporter n=1 Tax=Marinomonas sp. TaxID=1904862 RepID=UPI003C76AB91
MAFLTHFAELFLESAPWLLLGFILAGLLKVFVPMSWMNKQLGGHGLKSVVKAAVFGAPLPLCSCGVIPAAVGLRRAGASKASTTSFLVSTPETGVDSITVSYVLLGPFMAIIRPIAAVFSAILAGLLVGRDDDDGVPNTKSATQVNAKEASSCCATSTPAEPSCCGTTSTAEASCCSTNDAPVKSASITAKIRSSLHYAATELLDDTALWLLVGLGFAALVQTYIPSDFLASWGNGLLAMLVMVLISIPMYICATASTPIAAGLLLAGVAPGPVLVFMMAGPATNIATLGVVAKELGKKALVGYLTGVLGGALLFGFLVDFLVTKFDISVVPQIGPELTLLPSWVTLSTGVILAFLMVVSLTKQMMMKMNKGHSHQHSH